MSLENVTSPFTAGSSAALSAEDATMPTTTEATDTNPILNAKQKFPGFIAHTPSQHKYETYSQLLNRNRQAGSDQGPPYFAGILDAVHVVAELLRVSTRPSKILSIRAKHHVFTHSSACQFPDGHHLLGYANRLRARKAIRS